MGTNHKKLNAGLNCGEYIDNPLMITTNHHYFEFLTPAVIFYEYQVEYIIFN